MSSTHPQMLQKRKKKAFFLSLKNNPVIALRRMTQDEGHRQHKQAAGVNTTFRPVLHQQLQAARQRGRL